jgi:hypothetical protein
MPLVQNTGSDQQHMGTCGAHMLHVRSKKHTLVFFPITPPTTVSGNVMRAQMTTMMQMVPKGSAAVDRYTIATVLRKENITSMGPQKSAVVKITFRTQCFPPITLYSAAAT